MTPVLLVSCLEAWYGESKALHGMAFEVGQGQVVTLLGRNGAGKSSTLKSVMGLLRCKGSVQWNGREVMGLEPHVIAQLGIGFCPEERAIFTSLTVQENLRLPPFVVRQAGAGDAAGTAASKAADAFTEARIYDTFPSLRDRRKAYGGQLSGGEQQMLAIARILRAGSTLLLLDEPSEGLAPVVVDAIHDTLQALKRAGYTIVLVEQNLDFALSLGDRHYLVDAGQVVEQMNAADVEAGLDALTERLGV